MEKAFRDRWFSAGTEHPRIPKRSSPFSGPRNDSSPPQWYNRKTAWLAGFPAPAHSPPPPFTAPQPSSGPTIPAYCHKPAWLADMINTRPNRAFGRLLGTHRPHAWPRPVPYPQAPSGLGLTALSPMPMDRGARRVEKGLCPPLQEAGSWHSGWARQTGADQLVSPSRMAEKSNNILMKGK